MTAQPSIARAGSIGECKSLPRQGVTITLQPLACRPVPLPFTESIHPRGFLKMNTHGGKRAGSGRKRKVLGLYDSAYDFLLAVARGVEQASPEQRVAAARAVLPYEQPKKRATKASPKPNDLRTQEVLQRAQMDNQEWTAQAAAIRAKHERNT